MKIITLTPESILMSMTRIVHPDFGIDVVSLGTIYGIELSGSAVHIIMNQASDSITSSVKVGRLFPKKT